MPAFALLRTSNDWENYKAITAQQAGIGSVVVAWGSGPASYPCLAASIRRENPLGFNTCFVFADDARVLLGAAAPQSAAPLAVAAVGAPAAASAPASSVLVPGGPTWTDFAVSTAAHVAALGQWLIKTSICTQEQYERMYNRFLSQGDQRTEEERARLAETMLRQSVRPVDVDDVSDNGGESA